MQSIAFLAARTVSRVRIVPLCLLLMTASIASTAQASFVHTLGTATIENQTFVSLDPLAELVWDDVWYGTVTAHAQDTDSGQADDFQELLGNDGSITAQARSEASYSVTNGDQVAKGGGSISATVFSELTLDSSYKQADGFAIGTFDNFFFITGGNSGDPVDVTFTVDYTAHLSGTADQSGVFDSSVEALMRIEDENGNTVGDDLFFADQSGTNTAFVQNYSGTLSVTVPLLYDVGYSELKEVRIELKPFTTPIVGTPALMLVGLLILGRRRYRPDSHRGRVGAVSG